jgi:hypothetical protein
VKFCKWQFKLNSPVSSNGETLRNQLEVVYKTTGRMPEELQPPCELNELFYDAWKFFLDLHSSRSSNGFGLNPISYLEIQSYISVLQIQMQPWEIELIKLFDNTALQVISEQQEKLRQKQSQQNKVKSKK